jgi:glycosyltransferase involved in cell wall biosynthesis
MTLQRAEKTMSEPAPFPEKSTTLLTIMIPVYNGAKYLGHLLTLFADAYAKTPAYFGGVEIIVANNFSVDKTQEIAESFVPLLPILRPLALSPHLPTAEENIFRSFPYCTGTFTWALGVDDIPNFAVFDRVIALLADGRADFYLFNFASISEEMELTRTSLFYMKQTEYKINIVELTQRFGFWGTVAGMSGQIMRTASVRDYDFNGLIEQTSKIYAHVSAYLDCFKSSITLVINLPLVFYKWTSTSDAVVAHWRKGAKILGVFDEYFWTLGYIRQLKYLEKKSIISNDYLRYTLETNITDLFRPVFVVAEKFANQVRIMSDTNEERNQLTELEFDEIFEYLIQVEPFLRDFLWKLKQIYVMLLGGAKPGHAEWLELKRLEIVFYDYLVASLFQLEVGEYEVYRVAQSYYGVHRWFRHVLIDRLRHLDGEDFAPEVFTGRSQAEVCDKIISYERNSVDSKTIRREQGFDPSKQMADRKNVHASQNALAELNQKYQQLKQAHEQLMQTMKIIEQSLSWKLTKPLRWGREGFRKFLNRLPT